MADQQLREAFLRLMDAIERRKTELTGFQKMPSIDFTIAEAKTDFLSGEEDVAFDMLVENLYEVQFPITTEIYDAFTQLGQGIGLPQKRWLVLNQLVAQH